MRCHPPKRPSHIESEGHDNDINDLDPRLAPGLASIAAAPASRGRFSWRHPPPPARSGRRWLDDNTSTTEALSLW